MLDSVPVCASSNNTQETAGNSASSTVAEPRRITETFVVELDPRKAPKLAESGDAALLPIPVLDPGQITPSDAIPLNRGGAIPATEAVKPIQAKDFAVWLRDTSAEPDSDEKVYECDTQFEAEQYCREWETNKGDLPWIAEIRAIKPYTLYEARDVLPEHFQPFVDGLVRSDAAVTDSYLRKQAMKARRLQGIASDEWTVQYRPSTTIDQEPESKGHQFSLWADWIMEWELWADDRKGSMEDQFAEQLDEFAARLHAAAKRFRNASAEAGFIKQQMEANKGKPWPSCTVINAVQPDDELTEKQAAADIDAIWPNIEPAYILSDDEKQFFDQCMIRGMDDLLRGNAKKRYLLLMASDGDTMSGNETADAWQYVRDCILRVRGAALMLTHERRAVLSGHGGTGSANDVRDIASQGINWLMDFYKEKQ